MIQPPMTPIYADEIILNSSSSSAQISVLGG
jgi:hypothetical protein